MTEPLASVRPFCTEMDAIESRAKPLLPVQLERSAVQCQPATDIGLLAIEADRAPQDVSGDRAAIEYRPVDCAHHTVVAVHEQSRPNREHRVSGISQAVIEREPAVQAE